jgi:hypothetical protein
VSDRATVYSFATTSELLGGWRIARSVGCDDAIKPSAVVWLQSRPGQFSQSEIDAVLIADPLARPVVIAGALCAGEPRSEKLLLDVARLYWHQPLDAFWSLIKGDTSGLRFDARTGQWIGIHAAQLTDYEGLAGVCQSLGFSTLWQNDRWPIISSEPNYRMFRGWNSWERWCDEQATSRLKQPTTPAILVLDFPTPCDVERARESGLDHVLATPFRAGDLGACLGRRRAPSLSKVKVDRRVAQTSRVYGRAG